MTIDERMGFYRQTLDDVVLHGATLSSNLARDLDKLYHDVSPQSAPTNFSCNACVFEMVKSLRNIIISYGK